MPKLLETYSRATGLEISRNQFLLEKFYPLPSDKKYITIHASSGMPGKNYGYWNEVLDLIFPILHSNNIDIYQIGGKEDPPLKHCTHLQGLTDLHQTNYILSRSILHLCNDTFSAHRAGALGIPLVELFGPTEVENHAPLIYNTKSVFLKSHRFNKKPTFAAQENPATINLIKPETIVSSILQIFGVHQPNIGRESFLFGQGYQNTIVEIIPNFNFSPDSFKNVVLVLRLDYLDSFEGEIEKNIKDILSNRSCILVLNKIINPDFLKAFAKNIQTLNYEISESDDINYIKALTRLGIKVRFFTKMSDSEQLSKLRTKFFDLVWIEKFSEKTKQNFLEESEKYTNSKLDKDLIFSDTSVLWFRSNKFILSEGKIFLSKAHLDAKLPTNSFDNNIMNIIDHNSFWKEMDHFYIFKQVINKN
jgi:hypothetical protein